jgi:hypothetical protein
VADCCKRLCSALCVVTAASYGPCATVKSLSDLVHGLSALEAGKHLRHVRVWLSKLRERYARIHAASALAHINFMGT